METETRPSTSLRDFLYVVFKRKIQILVFFGVTVCTVAIASFTTRPTYEANAQILVKIGMEDVYVPALFASGIAKPSIRVDREQKMNSEIEIIKSRSLAEKVVESIGPAVIYEDRNTEPVESSKATRRLQRNLTVEAVTKSNVINISFTHPDPHLAATVVNKLVNLYLEHHLRVHKNPRFYAFFREQSQIFANKLKQGEEQLETFKKDHGLTHLGDEQKLLIGEMADLKSKLLNLELKEQEVLIKYTDESRAARNVRDEVEIFRQKLAKQEGRLSELDRFQMEFNRLQDQVEVDRKNYRLYLTKFEESRISNAMDTEKIANVSLIEPARPPDTPVSPKILLNMALSIFVGGIGAFGLAFFSEYLSDTLDRPEEVQDRLQLPVLSSIPELKT